VAPLWKNPTLLRRKDFPCSSGGNCFLSTLLSAYRGHPERHGLTSPTGKIDSRKRLLLVLSQVWTWLGHFSPPVVPSSGIDRRVSLVQSFTAGPLPRYRLSDFGGLFSWDRHILSRFRQPISSCMQQRIISNFLSVDQNIGRLAVDVDRQFDEERCLRNFVIEDLSAASLEYGTLLRACPGLRARLSPTGRTAPACPALIIIEDGRWHHSAANFSRSCILVAHIPSSLNVRLLRKNSIAGARQTSRVSSSRKDTGQKARVHM
jgi:hypothetical protein